MSLLDFKCAYLSIKSLTNQKILFLLFFFFETSSGYFSCTKQKQEDLPV